MGMRVEPVGMKMGQWLIDSSEIKTPTFNQIEMKEKLRKIKK